METVNFFNPQNEYEIKRRQALAAALRQQSAPKPTEVVSGFAIPQSGLSALASVVGQGAATIQDLDAAQTAQSDNEARKKFMLEAIQNSGGDASKLGEALLGQPATSDIGMKLYAEALKSKQDDAKFEKEAALKRELAGMRNGGAPYVDPDTGEIVQGRKLTSPETKEIFDSTDIINSSESAKTNLSKARNILETQHPYSGFGAEFRSSVARIPVIGDIIANKERGAATTDYGNLVTGQALDTLKSTFGGMPTEGERKILLQMQALPTYTPQEQERILANAQAAIERRKVQNRNKIRMIQTGSYQHESVPPTGVDAGGWSIEEVR